MNTHTKTLSTQRIEELFNTLKTRFDKNKNRHKNMEWQAIQKRLEINTDKLWSLYEMERTGGEPDVVGYDKKANEYIFSIVLWKVQRAAEAFVMIRKH